jgi:LysR family nitrogen assimilation transcriptional regulator
MDARILEYFLRVVEAGSINRAAGELNLSQPSLSRWLVMLEREVGTPLLIRTRRGVRPTDAGQQLAERAQPILRQLDLLRDEIGARATTQVALGMPFSLRGLVTVPLVAALACDMPTVALRVHEGMTHTIDALMAEGLVDVGVMVATAPPPDSYDTAPLFGERMFLVGPPGADLDPAVPVPVTRLAGLPLILPGRPNMIRVQVERAIRAAGGSCRNALEAETLTLCLELTRRGLGYTVMPASALHGRSDGAGNGPGALAAAPVEGLDLDWSLCANRARSRSVAVRAVAAALQRHVATHVGPRYGGVAPGT